MVLPPGTKLKVVLIPDDDYLFGVDSPHSHRDVGGHVAGQRSHRRQSACTAIAIVALTQATPSVT